MYVRKGNSFSKLINATEDERAWLTEYLTFEGERKGMAAAKGMCLFNMWSQTYPAGLDAMVAKAASADGIKVDFIDKREKPCLYEDEADLEWLRDYQHKAVIKVVDHKRGILSLPTAAGKTEIIVGLTRVLPCFWLALVHRSQLADDIAARYELRSPGLVAGRILEGRWDVPDDAQLVAATFQSLRAALKNKKKPARQKAVVDLLERAQGLIVDEAHTLPAQTFYDTAMMMKNAYYRVGLSGTPLARHDKKDQYSLAALGPIIYRVKPKKLIGLGVLAKPTVRMVTCVQGSGRTTWPGVYGELVVHSTDRNGIIVRATQNATKPAFVFVEETDHGKALSKLLFRLGIQNEFVWGNHSVDYRKSLIRRMVQGHFDVIVCSKVFNEGIDVPELRSVVNAGGKKSVIATLQRLGRGMRIDRDKDGKVREGGDVFEVYDVLDRGNSWLTAHATARRDAYLSQQYETIIEPEPAVQALRRRLTK